VGPNTNLIKFLIKEVTFLQRRKYNKSDFENNMNFEATSRHCIPLCTFGSRANPYIFYFIIISCIVGDIIFSSFFRKPPKLHNPNYIYFLFQVSATPILLAATAADNWCGACSYFIFGLMMYFVLVNMGRLKIRPCIR